MLVKSIIKVVFLIENYLSTAYNTVQATAIGLSGGRSCYHHLDAYQGEGCCRFGSFQQIMCTDDSLKLSEIILTKIRGKSSMKIIHKSTPTQSRNHFSLARRKESTHTSP